MIETLSNNLYLLNTVLSNKFFFKIARQTQDNFFQTLLVRVVLKICIVPILHNFRGI